MPRLVNRSLPLLAACVLGCTSSATQRSTGAGTVAAITPEDLQHRLLIIADDSMMGRRVGARVTTRPPSMSRRSFGGSDWRRQVRTEPTSRSCRSGLPRWIRRRSSKSTVRHRKSAERFPANDARGRATYARRRRGRLRRLGERPDGGDHARAGGGQVRHSHAERAVAAQPSPCAGPIRACKAIAIVMLENLPPEFVARYRDGRSVPDTSTNSSAVPVVWLSRSAAATLLGAEPGRLTQGASGSAREWKFWFPVDAGAVSGAECDRSAPRERSGAPRRICSH